MKTTSLIRSFAATFALVLTLAGAAAAQMPATKWWASERYIRELNLTTEQSQRVEDIFQAALPTLKGQKRALDQAEKEFERLVVRGADGEVMEQVGRVESLRAELSKSRTMMLLRMKKVLTTDQWIKLGALNQADEQARADRRPEPPKK